jgi:hypothetical protein
MQPVCKSMERGTWSVRRVGIWLCALSIGVVGCSARRSYDVYVPGAEVARRALDVALQAWQSGKPIRTFADDGKVPVQPVDNAWLNGHKLHAYEIVGPVHGDSPRCFAVRLWVDNEAEEETVRYYVLGIKPLWVFRQDDFDKMLHWSCSPTESGSVASRR